MNRQELVALGIDYHEQEWCSRLALTEGAAEQLLSELAREEALDEVAVLSTCNRVELYAVSADDVAAHTVLLRCLMHASGVDITEKPPLTKYSGVEVLRHLARVACGLESMVIGETEILGQVAAAIDRSTTRTAAGPIIVELFRIAVRAGKRARTETGISRHALSMGSLSVRHAASLTDGLERQRIVVLGTGVGAQQVLSNLPDSARGDLTIVSRERSRAEIMAQRWGGQAVLQSDLEKVLATGDVIFTATEGVDLITAQALRGRDSGHKLLIVDISAPSNVASDVASLLGVEVVSMADLDAAVDHALVRRKGERSSVERIIAEEVISFERWTFEQRAIPLVRELRQYADQTRRRLLEAACEQIGALDVDVRERVEKLTQSIVNSLLHKPTMRIRSAATDDAWEEYERFARDLFDLH